MTAFVKTSDRWIIYRTSKLDTGSHYFSFESHEAAPHPHAPLHRLWLVCGGLSAGGAEFSGGGLAQACGAAR
jgi:hypothetical protein